MPGSQLRKWLSIGLATAAFGAAAAALVWWLFADSGDLRQAGWAQTDSRVPARSVEPVEVFTASEFTAWRLGGGLDEVVVYDIVSEVRGAGVWLGTGLGLVRLEPSGRASIYRNFSNSPREWARELVFVGDAIALNLTLAPGNTNGEPVGTYLFHRADERFERVGEHTRALAFDGQHLLSVQGRSVVRFLPVRDAWMVEAVVPEVEICGEVEMTRAGGALWLSQQGVRRVGHGSEDIPCGVTRLVPGADATRWMKEDGLAQASVARSWATRARSTSPTAFKVTVSAYTRLRRVVGSRLTEV